MESPSGLSPAPAERPEPAHKIPATERVLDFILAELEAGRLGPGSRVNAARIAHQLELSAAPVREALCVLAGRGIVKLLPDRGAVMMPITSRDVQQLWEIIGPIGCVGVELAANAIRAGADPHDLMAAYDNILARARDASPLEFILALNEYHYVANRIGGNEYVTQALERMGIAYWDHYLVALIDVRANLNGYLENYRRLHDAVLAGDGPAAAAIVRFHANWSLELIRRAEDATPRRPRRHRATGRER